MMFMQLQCTTRGFLSYNGTERHHIHVQMPKDQAVSSRTPVRFQSQMLSRTECFCEHVDLGRWNKPYCTVQSAPAHECKANTHTHRHTHTDTHTHTHTPQHAHTCTHTPHTHAQTHTYTHRHTHTHVHTTACAHVHAHHTHTHTHTHTQRFVTRTNNGI